MVSCVAEKEREKEQRKLDHETYITRTSSGQNQYMYLLEKKRNTLLIPASSINPQNSFLITLLKLDNCSISVKL